MALSYWSAWVVDGWKGFLSTGMLRGTTALRGTAALEGTASLRHKYMAWGPYWSGLWGCLSGWSGVLDWEYIGVEESYVLLGLLVLYPLGFSEIALEDCSLSCYSTRDLGIVICLSERKYLLTRSQLWQWSGTVGFITVMLLVYLLEMR